MAIDVEELAKILHDAGREAVEKGKVVMRKKCTYTKAFKGDSVLNTGTLVCHAGFLDEELLEGSALIPSGKKCPRCNGSGFEPFLTWDGVKSEIVLAYQTEHKKMCLDKRQDERLKKLRKSQKITTLNKIRQISLMPGDEIESFTQKITALKPCFSFTPADIQNSPVCPHCNLIPIKGKMLKSVDLLVDDYIEESERMYSNWIESIKRHLDDPSAKKSIDLLNTSEKEAIVDFITNNDFPKDSETLKEFINAVNKVIKGLERISFSTNEMLNALKEGGYPCTADEIIDRFIKFINSRVSNKENSRIVL